MALDTDTRKLRQHSIALVDNEKKKGALEVAGNFMSWNYEEEG
jgi:hypothetical protein